jgi:hypothetical protein
MRKKAVERTVKERDQEIEAGTVRAPPGSCKRP